MILAGFGCAAAFFGASQLQTHPLMSPTAFIPLACGVGAIVLLVTHQYLARHPLMPVRQLATTFARWAQRTIGDSSSRASRSAGSR